MSQITINELRELFGDELPIEAAKILFPEKFWDGTVIEKSVDEVRAELRALAERKTRISRRVQRLKRVRRVRHLKRGTEYEVAFVGAEVQVSTRPLIEGDLVTVYVGEDGKAWVRLQVEFEDGRYEEIPTP